MPTTRPQRVLFAVWGDARPTAELVRVAGLARAMDADLHVVRVIHDPAHFDAFSGFDTRVHDAAGLRGFLDACRQTQQWCSVALPSPLSEEHWEVRMGGFVAEVAARAAELQATWIAVAQQGPRPGRLVTELARAAALPVLLTHASTAGKAIVAATDLGDQRYPVLLGAAALGEQLGAQLIAVHNLAPPSSYARVDVARHLAQRQCSDPSEVREQRLRRAARRLSAGAESVLASEKDAVDAILKQARGRNAEIIVIGTRTHPWLHRLVVGSVSANLIDRAVRSVLVMPLDG